MATRQRGRLSKHLKGRQRWLLLGGIIIIFVLAFALVRHNSEQKAARQSHYHLLTVSPQAAFTITGRIEPVQTQTLDVPTGKLQELNVRNGDHVTRGTTILTMHNDNAQESATDLQTSLSKDQRTVSAQQQTINNLQRQLNGMDSSDDGYSDLQNQLTEARNAYADAQASVAADQQRLNTANGKVNPALTAPYDGTVTIDQTKQDQPVVTLYSDSLQFVGQVSEYDYSKLNQGTNLTVKALATGRKEKAVVSYLAVVPTKESGNNSKYEVTANLNPDKFMAGQTATASLKQSAVLIPKSAVVHGHVYVVEDGRARRVNVSGHAVNASYTVTDGVDAGDRIVTNPDRRLKNNMKVVHND